jgi:phage baseplate assembly protein V
MMDRIVNRIKAEAASQAAAFGRPRFGIVTSYKPGLAKVQLQPEGTLTGWLPVCSTSVGAGWGLHVPLKGGEQVLVLPQDGNAEHGVIVGRVFSDKMQPPDATGQDLILQSSGGAIIKLSTDGHITVIDASGSTLSFTNDNHVSLTTKNFTFNGESFTVNASIGVTIQTPDVAISQQVHIGTGPLKVNNVTVIVP